MNNTLFAIFTFFLMSGLLLIAACDNGSNSVFNEDWEFERSDPVIEDFDPPERTLAGVRSIRILGENFPDNTEEVLVYFNGVKAPRIFNSDENVITVRPANVPGDSVEVRVVVLGANQYATKVYALDPSVVNQPTIEDTDIPWAMTTGPDGSIYFSNTFDGNPQGTFRIDPDNNRTMYAERTTWRYQAMRYGPDDAIYMLRTGAGSLLHRIPPEGGSDPPWAMITRMDGLDFDADGYLWAAGRNQVFGEDNQENAALFRIDSDAEVERFPFNVNVGAVRIFDGYIYAAGTRTETEGAGELIGVWRFPLQNGTTGDAELYFNWTAEVGESTRINALEITDQGSLLIGTNGPKAIVKVHNDGSWEHFYEEVVNPTVYAMSWLPESSILMVTIEANPDYGTSQRILRVNTALRGAPYHGWN